MILILDVNPLLTGEKSSIDLAFDFAPAIGEEPPIALVGVTFPKTATAKGKVTDSAGYMRLTLSVTVPWSGECARCLTPVDGVLTFSYERTIAAKGTLENEDEVADYSDEYLICEHGRLLLDSGLSERICFEFPEKVLCRPDCPGLCPQCGAPLSNGDCGCRTERHDPRWDALRSMSFPDEPDENDKK